MYVWEYKYCLQQGRNCPENRGGTVFWNTGNFVFYQMCYVQGYGSDNLLHKTVWYEFLVEKKGYVNMDGYEHPPSQLLEIPYIFWH